MKVPAVAMTSLAVGVSTVAFFTKVRPWYLRWGATDAGRASHAAGRACPGSDAEQHDGHHHRRAARGLAVAGADGRSAARRYYSYTWIERLVGLRIDNVDTILPQFQTCCALEALDRKGTMRVLAVEPGHHLVLGPPDSVGTVQCTWAFGLYPVGQQATRLVTRCRARWSYRRMLETPLYALLPWLLIEPGAFVMERKMLLEIKERAERARMARITLVPEPKAEPRENEWKDVVVHAGRNRFNNGTRRCAMNRSIGRRSFLKTSLALGAAIVGTPIGRRGVRAVSGPVIETSSGRLEGGTGNVLVFRGIPFAKSPVGPLRFRPPEPPDPWTGIRAAASFGPGGPQGVNPVAAVLPSSFRDERGLPLPQRFTPDTTGKRPVLVWIHGGGNITGAGSQLLYDGSELVRRGDVVVVTLNYRLGIFGFLHGRSVAGEAFPTSGNEALLDQITALAVGPKRDRRLRG